MERNGFETANYPTIRVQGGHTTSLQVKLKVGRASESVIVSGSPLLNSVDTTNGYTLDNAQVQQVPLATGSFTQLAVLAPGANAQFINGTGTNEGLGNQALWVNGQRATDNTFTVNGIDVSNLFNGNTTSQEPSGRVVPNTGENFESGGVIQTNTSVYDAIGNALPTPSPEMIQEMSVNTSMYDAMQGETSGAQVSLSTMTGSNKYHGQTFASHQTNWLNAAPFFYKQQSEQHGGSIPENEVNPEMHRWTSGGTVSGPIMKDKLFLFLGYNRVYVTDLFNGISGLSLPTGLTGDRSISGLVAAVQSSQPSGATPFCPGGSASCFDPATGVSGYNALQVQLQKRMSHGLQFGLSYTWSHSLDEQSGLGLFYNGSDPLNLRSGYGSSDYDLTHDTTFNFTYMMPDMIHELNVLSRIVNGWGVNILRQSRRLYGVSRSKRLERGR